MRSIAAMRCLQRSKPIFSPTTPPLPLSLSSSSPSLWSCNQSQQRALSSHQSPSLALPRVKICCIESEDEARLAIRAGASAIGLTAFFASLFSSVNTEGVVVYSRIGIRNAKWTWCDR
jgi:hypothetical protein